MTPELTLIDGIRVDGLADAIAPLLTAAAGKHPLPTLKGPSQWPTYPRGVVKGSNMEGAGGDRRNNGFLPLGGGAATVHPANMAAGGDKRNGSFPLRRAASRITPPNHKFDVGMVKMPQPESAIEPGKGTVPVNPFLPGGAAARVAGQVADEAKPK